MIQGEKYYWCITYLPWQPRPISPFFTGPAFIDQTNTLSRVFFQWPKMHSRRLLIISFKLQLSLSMYGYLCNGNPSEKTVTEARCYANCLEWVSKE